VSFFDAYGVGAGVSPLFFEPVCIGSQHFRHGPFKGCVNPILLLRFLFFSVFLFPPPRARSLVIVVLSIPTGVARSARQPRTHSPSQSFGQFSASDPPTLFFASNHTGNKSTPENFLLPNVGNHDSVSFSRFSGFISPWQRERVVGQGCSFFVTDPTLIF